MSHSTLMSRYRSSKTSSSALSSSSEFRSQTFLLLNDESTDSYSFTPSGHSGGEGGVKVVKGATFMKSTSSAFNHNNNVLTLHPPPPSPPSPSSSHLLLHHATGPHLETLTLPAECLSSQFGLKSRYLLMAGEGSTSVYDLKKKSTVRTFAPPTGQSYITSKFNFSQNLVLSLTSSSLLIYTLKDAKCLTSFQSNNLVFKDVEVNRFQDFYTVLTSGETVGTDGYKEIYKLPNSTCASHSKVNRLLLSTCKSNLATFYDTNTFRVIKSLNTGISDILDCGFSHDGVHFVGVGRGGTEIWDLRNVERPVWKGEGGRKVVWESKRKESKNEGGGMSVASVASIKSLRSPALSPGRNSVKSSSSFKKDDSISGRVDLNISQDASGGDGCSSVDEIESVMSKATTAASSVVGSVEESLRRLKGEGGLTGINDNKDTARRYGGGTNADGGDTVMSGVISEVTGASRSTLDTVDNFEDVREITPTPKEMIAPSTPVRKDYPPPAPEVAPDSPLPPSPIRRVESPRLSPVRRSIGEGLDGVEEEEEEVMVPTPVVRREDGGLDMADLTSPGGLNLNFPTLREGEGGGRVGEGGGVVGLSLEHKLALDNLPQNIADLQGMVTGLHVEMLRQFQYMQDDNDVKMGEFRNEIREVMEENGKLKRENEKLRGIP
ncbi:hypothetical protein TrLO_g14395 [Triparma laevis f. longispina]|uniref:Uncharacterized protein n=1 Tax=Triparma laevis f. longispina TaxID=1714387 RepID=A0A9W7FVK7_9STRA|nr:hypothetical protein TrLO_g14395 [Triparma laevis f. longispina]